MLGIHFTFQPSGCLIQMLGLYQLGIKHPEGRGGTCDISAWDSFYLSTFWMLNTNAWVIFYFHWKFITLSTPFQFDESSTYLNGWFRDYLWFYSSSLIRGYDAL